jgi:hypothetical protein
MDDCGGHDFLSDQNEMKNFCRDHSKHQSLVQIGQAVSKEMIEM